MEREFHFFVEPETDIENSEESEDFILDGAEKAEGRNLIVRLDKWLWAARFFKTRALARAAVEAGKVFYNGERSKPSREIEVGAILQIRHGRFEKTVEVKGLSTRRRSTDEALQLFEETEESKSLREQFADDFTQNQFTQPNFGYNPNHHNTYHSEQSSYAHQGGSSQDQRPVRFLRRAFARQEPPRHEQREPRSPYHNNHTPYNRPSRSMPHYQNQNQNPNYHPNHHYHPNHANHNNNPYYPSGYQQQSGHQPPSGYQQQTGYQPQNYNNPVYPTRHQNTSYNSPHNHPRHHNSHYNNAISNNKTEPQTEYD